MPSRADIFAAGVWSLLGTFAACLGVVAITGCGKPATAAPDRPAFVSRAESVGTSMLPTFAAVETVLLERCRFSDLRARDTVIYWHNETRQYIHHRLSHRDATDGRWITAGDNNPTRDWGRFTADEFEGRTHKIVPTP